MLGRRGRERQGIGGARSGVGCRRSGWVRRCSRRGTSLVERQRIATLRGHASTVREVARRLARSASTISREGRRNMTAHDGGWVAG
jgi:hypothetical protein